MTPDLESRARLIPIDPEPAQGRRKSWLLKVIAWATALVVALLGRAIADLVGEHPVTFWQAAAIFTSALIGAAFVEVARDE